MNNRFFSFAMFCTASPTDDTGTSRITSTWSTSYHRRAIPAPTSGLSWWSPTITLIGLPKTLPPKSATAICAAVTEPWPVGVDPGPLMSVSTPILTTSSETCASAAVEASIARASAASMGKYLLSTLSPPVAFDATAAMTRPGPLGRATQSQRTGRFSSPQRGAHLLPEPGAAQERTLEAVRCSALLKNSWCDGLVTLPVPASTPVAFALHPPRASDP